MMTEVLLVHRDCAMWATSRRLLASLLSRGGNSAESLLAVCAQEPDGSAGLRPGALGHRQIVPGRRPALRVMESPARLASRHGCHEAAEDRITGFIRQPKLQPRWLLRDEAGVAELCLNPLRWLSLFDLDRCRHQIW